MASTQDLNIFSVRLATFSEPQHLAKRRASSTKKKTPGTVTWPHKHPEPQELAKAGFFYNPSTSATDNVTCFLCDKSLDGWDENDNPAQEHLRHVPTCGWAINVCIEQRLQDEEREEEDPMSDRYVDARRATFKDGWPHENKKGWKCKTKKMADAGWCYTPLVDADDNVTCFYCNLSLDGWEPKDDPMQEHRRRAETCGFFSLIDDTSKAKKSAKSKKARASTASRAARTSTQSRLSIASQVPSLPDLDAEELSDLAAEGDSVLSTASTMSKAGRGRKATTKAKKAPKRAPKKNTKAQKEAPTELVEGEDTSIAEPEPEVKPVKRQRAKRPTNQSTAVADSSMIDALGASSPPAKRGRPRRVVSKQTKANDDDEPANNPSAVPARTGSKPTRGRKRMSDGQVKMESSVIMVDEVPMPKAQSKKDKVDTAAAAPPEEADVDELAMSEVEDAPEPEPEPKPAAKRATKSKQMKKASAVSKRSASVQTKQTQEPDEGAVEAPQPKGANRKGRPATQRASKDSQHDGGAKRANQTKAAEPLRPSTPPADVANPSPSPQSSDAENRPPSSRPSNVDAGQVSPSKTSRVPLAPATPRASPTKRNVIAGGLVSTEPWSNVDLETLFSPTPSSQNKRPRYGDNKENPDVGKALERLTSAEKNMTVEEWIYWNAAQAETRLRDECEGMIGAFEREGNRALRSLEGVEAA